VNGRRQEQHCSDSRAKSCGFNVSLDDIKISFYCSSTPLLSSSNNELIQLLQTLNSLEPQRNLHTMQFSWKTILLLSSILGGTVPTIPIASKNIVEVECKPLNFMKLFTATLKLGHHSNYMLISDGVFVNEAITSGKLVRPATSGAIKGGFAYSPIYNGTLQVSVIDLYGTSDYGIDHYIHETGIGSNAAQITRIVS
jgi:hypothetical protein